tara:strand:+ start:2924 stop:4084 length:1161 start_codon:yes stop_codon:yes gene_type:complete
MAPGIAMELLQSSAKPIRVLDPMMGSGTVIAMARANGHRAFGIDIDPLAVLISQTWTSSCDIQTVQSTARDILKRAQIYAQSLAAKDAYPPGADKETKQFIRYWFDLEARRELTSLAYQISKVQDEAIRTPLWCGFSRLIITKKSGASLAMDLSHSRPHKVFSKAPNKPFSKFLASIEKVTSSCIDKRARLKGPAASVTLGDARKLKLSNNSIDLVLTSPPYLNAIDYIRCSKFSLVWMGHTIKDLRDLRSNSIGAEVGKNFEEDPDIQQIIEKLKLKPALNKRGQSILARFIDDLRQSINEVGRVLVPNGKAIYVMGENTIRGTYIENAKITSILAKNAGLKLIERKTRSLPQNRRYLPAPSKEMEGSSLNGRMRKEVVLAFIKI